MTTNILLVVIRDNIRTIRDYTYDNHKIRKGNNDFG